jgi:tRNA pseudouridine32 synthase / 23S rRNA pseudouridine746 synthase
MMHIIYEDPDILVINKPSGVLSIADGYDKNIPHLRTLLEPEFGRLWIVHRLDKETSGVVILARSAEAHKDLNGQFSYHLVRKEYAALVYGIPPEEFSDKSPLLVNGDRRHRTIGDETRGKPAQTKFSLDRNLSEFASLVKAKPLTGFTHQIRSHLLHSGFPILGDLLYSTPESTETSLRLELPRVALHSQKITIVHPNGGEYTFLADFPDDFIEMIKMCTKREHQSG